MLSRQEAMALRLRKKALQKEQHGDVPAVGEKSVDKQPPAISDVANMERKATQAAMELIMEELQEAEAALKKKAKRRRKKGKDRGGSGGEISVKGKGEGMKNGAPSAGALVVYVSPRVSITILSLSLCNLCAAVDLFLLDFYFTYCLFFMTGNGVHKGSTSSTNRLEEDLEARDSEVEEEEEETTEVGD